MSTAFVAVIRASRVPAGLTDDLGPAAAVHSLGDLGGCAEPDDALMVLLDPVPAPAAQVDAVLATLRTVDDPGRGVVVASVRPVTDTLKRVTSDGTLAGTADREHHRFVTAPIAARLGLLRQALEQQPEATTAGEILAALADQGATVVATA